MSWIKRNLFFSIGGVVALGLLAGAGLYLWQNYKLRAEKKEKLTAGVEELGRLAGGNPGPGDGKKTDNTKAAKEYQGELRGFIQRSSKFFKQISPIPESAEGTNAISDHEFASSLRDTIGKLTRDAQNASVSLPPAYDFSFYAIKSKITFAPGSLEPLAVQLGEVKAICEVLFRAKINSLDSIRRSRVSPDDREMADYIEDLSITNELDILTPYEITFHSFSGDLAGVLAGFAASPYAITVKRVLVESAGAPSAPVGDMPSQTMIYSQPVPTRARSEDDDMGARPAPAPVASVPGVTPRGQLPTVLNELPLRVTLRLELVKRLEATR